MTKRLVSLLSASPIIPKVKHFFGLPPEATGGHDARQQMGSAFYLVIEQTHEGVFLYRYDDKGACVGDTWHMGIDEAKHQASYEYEGLVQDWQDVPGEVEDAAAFGLTRLKEATGR